MEDRMAILSQVKGQISTHNCPECKGPAYCGMEDGKSGNLCWCMTVNVPEDDACSITLKGYDTCLCRRCLTSMEI